MGRQLVLGGLGSNCLSYGTGHRALLDRGCWMNEVKLLIVSTIAQERTFLKILVDGVILFGFSRAKVWENAAATT